MPVHVPPDSPEPDEDADVENSEDDKRNCSGGEAPVMNKYLEKQLLLKMDYKGRNLLSCYESMKCITKRTSSNWRKPFFPSRTLQKEL